MLRYQPEVLCSATLTYGYPVSPVGTLIGAVDMRGTTQVRPLLHPYPTPTPITLYTHPRVHPGPSPISRPYPLDITTYPTPPRPLPPVRALRRHALHPRPTVPGQPARQPLPPGKLLPRPIHTGRYWMLGF